jgi:hypothetical protein
MKVQLFSDLLEDAREDGSWTLAVLASFLIVTMSLLAMSLVYLAGYGLYLASWPVRVVLISAAWGFWRVVRWVKS